MAVESVQKERAALLESMSFEALGLEQPNKIIDRGGVLAAQ
jgi:hypothetical protein